MKLKIISPHLSNDDSSDLIPICLQTLKKNSTSAVSFGTEAGVFSELGFETVVCGPGSIRQAHKPNEFVDIKQLEECKRFLLNLVDQQY